MKENNANSAGTIVGGLILVGLGVLFLISQFFQFDFWGHLWPLFVIGFGLTFFVAMFVGGKSAGGLAIPGSFFTVLGLLFLYQSTFNHFESWAYAWTLPCLVGTGVGQMIYARWSDKPNLFQPGLSLTLLGLTIFVVMGTFFEVVVGFAHWGDAGRLIFPLLLISLGIILLAGSVVRSWISPRTSTSSSAISSPQQPR